MKYYNRILLLAMVAGITVSCADGAFCGLQDRETGESEKV